MMAGISLAQNTPEERCLSLVNAGEYQKAIEIGNKLIKRNPSNFLAYSCLAYAYYSLGDLKSSLKYAQKMERLAKNDDELGVAYNRLGLAYHKIGDLDNAFFIIANN
ncbi:tetratricopeptide repeat protein [Thermodesulfovibrio sp. 3907-1M]|uniref:Tetratricopeptide repeat protein n=1 Tax=Thermodesulfovibrio autotrophicus TaxID=3118333 RepID=A0AAU8GYL9_9BACT